MKATAPRRKAKPVTSVTGEASPIVTAAAPVVMRGTKLTCAKRVCNGGKWAALQPLFSRVCSLKNEMSNYVHGYAALCITGPYALKAQYKLFKSSDLNAWERQALFHDIVGDYQRSLAQRFSASPFRLQNNCKPWSYLTFLRATGIHPKNAVKPGSFELNLRQSTVTSLANYLMRVDIALFDPLTMDDKHRLKLPFLAWRAAPGRWARLCAVAQTRQNRLAGRQKLVHYVAGTFRVNPAESRMSVYVDKTNEKHQLWLKLRLGVGKAATFEHLPLASNARRLDHIAKGDVENLGFDTEFRLKFCSGRKLHVCTVYAAEAPVFMPEEKHLGIDLNTKRSFANDSEGRGYHLDALVMQQGLALLSRIDAAGGVSRMGYRRAAQLRQWVRRNAAHIKNLLGGWLDEWKSQGVTDVWLEDMAMSFDATMIRHDLGEKYSRILRLMRLSAVKDWVFSMGEKRGIRVHTTPAAYTSQRCPAPGCGHVDRANRPSQAVFKCVACGHVGDADHVAGINIVDRGQARVIDLIHEKDEYGRCSPRAMKRSALKALLLRDAEIMQERSAESKAAGGVSDLPTPAKSKKPGRGRRGPSGSSIHAA